MMFKTAITQTALAFLLTATAAQASLFTNDVHGSAQPSAVSKLAPDAILPMPDIEKVREVLIPAACKSLEEKMQLQGQIEYKHLPGFLDELRGDYFTDYVQLINNKAMVAAYKDTFSLRLWPAVEKLFAQQTPIKTVKKNQQK